MKNSRKQNKLTLEKLKITKLKSSDNIKGGFVIGGACIGDFEDCSSNGTDTITDQLR